MYKIKRINVEGLLSNISEVLDKALGEAHETVEICFMSFPQPAGELDDENDFDPWEHARTLVESAAKRTITFANSKVEPVIGLLNRFILSPCC